MGNTPIELTRGTTPLLVFNLPFDTSLIKTAWVTVSQRGEEVFTCITEQLTMSGSTISVKLTQAQTLLLKPQKNLDNCLEIQIRILTTGGDAIASKIMETTVAKILKDGEIK